MIVSVAVGALVGYPLKTTLAMAARAGSEAVEVMATARLCAEGPERTTRLLRDTGLSVASVHAQLHYRPVPIDRAIESDRASIRWAGELRDDCVLVLHPPLTGPRPSPDLNRWLEAIVSERDAVNRTLVLAIENRADNHDGIAPQLFDDIDRMRSIAGEWGLRLTLDLAHEASWSRNPLDAASQALPLLANVHLSDARASHWRGGIRNGLLRDHQLPGAGTLPLGEIVAALSHGGYRGPLTIELSPLSLRAWWPRSAQRRLTAAVRDVRSMVERAPAPPAARTRSGSKPR